MLQIIVNLTHVKMMATAHVLTKVLSTSVHVMSLMMARHALKVGYSYLYHSVGNQYLEDSYFRL